MQQPHLQEHIQLIARHEQEFQQNRTRSECAGDAIASAAGSLVFVMAHLLLFGTWIIWNALPHTASMHFDAYPFPMLDTVVALEAILLSSFILMRQTRSGRRSEQREHLMLQLLLLTEKEATKLLEINTVMAEKLGLKNFRNDAELVALTSETSIDEVAETIREALPTDA